VVRGRGILKYETNTFIGITEKLGWNGPSVKAGAAFKLRQAAHSKHNSKYILARQ